MKFQHEWRLQVPWGQLALVSRGHPDGEPVLLVHGRQDSSSVFTPILNMMTDQYYYVALDMPGNGLSDAFPKGKILDGKFVKICLMYWIWNQIEEWHSSETVTRKQEQPRLQDQATSSNDARNPLEARPETQSPVLESEAVSDGRKGEMKNPGPPDLGTLNGENPERIRITYEVPKASTCPDGAPALDLSEIIRHMRENDAVGYLSWDNRLKNLAPQNYGIDYYYELFKTIPPSLFVVASDGVKSAPNNPIWRDRAMELIDRLSKLENFNRVDVEGSHDVHFTHPERVAPYVIKFLQENKIVSKL
ncbi:hypothetical protein HF086_009767 [Spodoptera exigua]|uniref:Serine hydrolase-like protein n=1 Tax=Spodoptera exigua TaxID=7107 RepID=A0A922MC06_SPOEX|nr:hypothetical protein HF086_009767 [Spodoptera exigua]